MPHNNTIFYQLFDFIPRHRFEKRVSELGADGYCKYFTAWKQFLTVLYSQVTGKDSLREIESGLISNSNKLYHLGLDAVPKSTLSEAMNRRSSVIYEEIFNETLQRTMVLAPKHKFKFDMPLYIFDSTLISLALSVYDWAHYRKKKGGIKLHFQFDNSGYLPCFMIMSEGKCHDMKQAKKSFVIEPDSMYCFDKGYYDLRWYKHIDNSKAYFVTRLKINADIVITGQHKEPNPDKGIVSDEVIEFCSNESRKKYPGKLRMIRFFDKKTSKVYCFITNNFSLTASTIAEIYHQRWEIEIFFKWIKQNLKIKSFLGTSQNAVLTQIWIALIYYLIVSYLKFLSKVSFGITEICRRIRECLMDRRNLLELLGLSRQKIAKPPEWNIGMMQPELWL
jgi:hypothetical protein